LSEAVSQLAAQHPHIRGVIIGTRGIGLGLDDPALEPLWAALAETGLVVFLHPHYGVGAQAWGPRNNGHVLPLALGFPFETTTVRALHSALCKKDVIKLPVIHNRQLHVSSWQAFLIATQSCAFFSRTPAAPFHSCPRVLHRASIMTPFWQVGSPTTRDGISASCGLMQLRMGQPN
jgi:hypothetical protein